MKCLLTLHWEPIWKVPTWKLARSTWSSFICFSCRRRLVTGVGAVVGGAFNGRHCFFSFLLFCIFCEEIAKINVLIPFAGSGAGENLSHPEQDILTARNWPPVRVRASGTDIMLRAVNFSRLSISILTQQYFERLPVWMTFTMPVLCSLDRKCLFVAYFYDQSLVAGLAWPLKGKNKSSHGKTAT